METVLTSETDVLENVLLSPQALYERERQKPMPSKNHSRIQIRLGSAILVRYEDQYDVRSEQSLGPPNPPFLPDLSIFPAEVST